MFSFVINLPWFRNSEQFTDCSASEASSEFVWRLAASETFKARKRIDFWKHFSLRRLRKCSTRRFPAHHVWHINIHSAWSSSSLKATLLITDVFLREAEKATTARFHIQMIWSKYPMFCAIFSMSSCGAWFGCRRDETWLTAAASTDVSEINTQGQSVVFLDSKPHPNTRKTSSSLCLTS